MRPHKEALDLAEGVVGGGGGVPPNGSSAAAVAQTVLAFVDWLCGQLRRPSSAARGVPTAVHCLSRLLREAAVRPAVHRAGGVQLLAPLAALPTGGGQLDIQLLYEATLAVWQLSYYRPAADLLASSAVVGGLVDTVRLAQVGGAPGRWGGRAGGGGARRRHMGRAMIQAARCTAAGGVRPPHPHPHPHPHTHTPTHAHAHARTHTQPHPRAHAQKEKLVRVALLALRNLLRWARGQGWRWALVPPLPLSCRPPPKKQNK